jgi:hypothetical protein
MGSPEAARRALDPLRAGSQRGAGCQRHSPATIGEILDYGLFGWAMSRYSGSYVALKCVTDTLDLTASVELPDAHRA